MTISETIEELMEEKGLNSEQLSEKIGVSASVILRWKKNETSLFLSNLLKLSDVFECSLEYIAGRSSDFGEDYEPKVCPPFAVRLREVLSEKKKSVYRIVKDTRISSASFHYWFNGADPTLSSLITLADYLDCTLDYLVGRES